jgi:hypothetical protein
MKKAEESMPVIYQAFTHTINEREKGVTHGL